MRAPSSSRHGRLPAGRPAPPAATRAPWRTVSARTARRCRPRRAGRGRAAGPGRRGRPPGRRTTRSPPSAATASAHRSRSAYDGRATRQSGSLTQKRPCCQARAASGISPRRPWRAVLAALVEGVGRDAHRVDQADARQQRRAAADQVDLGADHLADEREPGPVGLDTGHVLDAAGRARRRRRGSRA